MKDISSYEKLKEHKKQVHEHGFKNSKNLVGAHKQKESLQSLNLRMQKIRGKKSKRMLWSGEFDEIMHQWNYVKLCKNEIMFDLLWCHIVSMFPD